MPNQNKIAENMSARIKHPITIAGVFGGLFQIWGRRASDTDLAERWADIMGSDIASIAKLVAIKKMRDNKFSIVIRPTNPALTLQLSYSKDEILRRINKYFGYNAISKITFRK